MSFRKNSCCVEIKRLIRKNQQAVNEGYNTTNFMIKITKFDLLQQLVVYWNEITLLTNPLSISSEIHKVIQSLHQSISVLSIASDQQCHSQLQSASHMHMHCHHFACNLHKYKTFHKGKTKDKKSLNIKWKMWKARKIKPIIWDAKELSHLQD